MTSLQTFKDTWPRLFLITDRCLVFFLLFPCVVAFWAGIWVLLDVHFYPENDAIGAWSCAAVGAIILIFLNVVQYELTERYLEPSGSLRNIVVKRLYTLVAGCANVFLCRGFWMIQDHYSGVTVHSALFSFIFGTVLLVALRASCNGVASPLGTAFDEHRSFFIIQTRFRTTGDRPLLLLLDSVFSVTVIGTLVIFEWRGIWVLIDLLLYPDQPAVSIAVCLTFGYLTCFTMDALQDQAAVVSAYLEARNHSWFLRLAFEDVYLFVAKVAVIAVWHGVWMFCENVVVDIERPGGAIRAWIPVVVGYVVLTLLLHANSLFVLEVVLDGGLVEGAGCRIRVTMLENYLKLCAKNRQSRKEKQTAQLKMQAEPGHDRHNCMTSFRNESVLLPAGTLRESRSFLLSEILPP